MPKYFKTYHLSRYLLVEVTLWCVLGIYGSFTVGRVHAHQVRVQRQETRLKAKQQAIQQRKQVEMKRQVPKLQAQVNELQKQATSLNQRNKHVILPSDADEKLKSKIVKQVNQLKPKIAQLDTKFTGVSVLQKSYRQLQHFTEGYGF